MKILGLSPRPATYELCDLGTSDLTFIRPILSKSQLIILTSQSPGRKQMAHSKQVIEESLIKRLIIKVRARIWKTRKSTAP